MNPEVKRRFKLLLRDTLLSRSRRSVRAIWRHTHVSQRFTGRIYNTHHAGEIWAVSCVWWSIRLDSQFRKKAYKSSSNMCNRSASVAPNSKSCIIAMMHDFLVLVILFMLAHRTPGACLSWLWCTHLISLLMKMAKVALQVIFLLQELGAGYFAVPAAAAICHLFSGKKTLSINKTAWPVLLLPC